jgi:hypothetical protein
MIAETLSLQSNEGGQTCGHAGRNERQDGCQHDAELEETMERRKKHLMMAMWNIPTETCKTVQDPGMMQSVEEHQEIPTEDAAVMPVRGLKKRSRVQKLAAERRQKPKEGARGYCGSRKRVTIAVKRTPRHATVAWWKINLTRNIRIQGSRESPKEFAAAEEEDPGRQRWPKAPRC